MDVGVVGVGRMGRPLVERLASAGHRVLACVRRLGHGRPVAQGLVRWVDDLSAVAASLDVVFIVVQTDEQVRQVCLGAGGAIAHMAPGSTLVQHTTCDPDTVLELARCGAARGVSVLDAALSGGPHDIVRGALTLWVGADEERELERRRALLSAYASPVTYVGPVGHGQRVKLVNNALFVAQVGLAIDALRVGQELGISPECLLGALPQGSAASRALQVVARGGSVQQVAERVGELMRKDVNMVREVAASAKAELGILGVVLESEAVERWVLGLRTGQS